MAQPLMLPSFAAGEIAPSLFARIDLAKFHTGAALLRNFFVDYRGGVANRAGTRYVGNVLQPFQAARLIPFQFSTVQAYALLFGHNTMKVIANGGFVLDSAHPGLEYQISTPYLGSELALLKFAQSADVMTLCHPNHPPMNLTRTANDNWTLVAVSFAPSVNRPSGVVATANTPGPAGYSYQVTALGSNGVTESLPSQFTAFTTANSATMSTTPLAHITIATGGLVAGAVLYNFYRSPEVPDSIAVAGQSYGFIGSSTTGAFVDANIAPDFTQTPPQAFNPFATFNGVQSVSITPGRGYLSPPAVVIAGDGAGAAITVRLQLMEQTPYFGGSGYTRGDVLTLVGGTFVRAAKVILISNPSDPPVYVIIDSGDYSVLPGSVSTATFPYETFNVGLSGGTGAGASLQCVWGLGTATITNPGANYTTISATLTGGGPPSPGGGLVVPCLGPASQNPTCTTYFQSRQIFAAPTAQPQTLFASKSGDFKNMGYSIPSRPDDALVETLASQQVNAIKHLISTNSLIALTSKGAWRIDGGQQGSAITPTSAEASPQAFSGCSDVPPIMVNYDILYVQEKQSIVRDLAYNFYVNVYTGADMTTLSNHLFVGHRITEWAYAEEPHKIIWCVREDGTLLSFTFMKEQEVYAWSHHDTYGQFKSVCSIPEGDEDAVYVVVQRQVASGFIGLTQYVERLQSRNLRAIPERGIPGDLTRCWFVDCGLSTSLFYPNAVAVPIASPLQLDGPVYPSLAISGATVVDGGTGYTTPTVNVIDATGTGAIVSATVVAGVITALVVVSGGGNYTQPSFLIVDPNPAATGAVVQPQTARPLEIQVTNNDPAVLPFLPILGDILRINHGYGRIMSILGGGLVVIDVIQPLANAYPAFYQEWSSNHLLTTVGGLTHLRGLTVSILADGNVQPQQVVPYNGIVTLEQPASFVVVGLPYKAQFQTLPFDVPGEQPTVQGKRKKITAATLRIQDSRGIELGQDFVTMTAFKERDSQPMGDPIMLVTGDERILLDASWDEAGQICAQQQNPLPATLLGLVPEVAVGDS